MTSQGGHDGNAAHADAAQTQPRQAPPPNDASTADWSTLLRRGRERGLHAPPHQKGNAPLKRPQHRGGPEQQKFVQQRGAGGTSADPAHWGEGVAVAHGGAPSLRSRASSWESISRSWA